MNKRLFLLLIVFMTLSLLGIIFVQGYWIYNSYKTKEEQFTINVKQVLLDASKDLQLKETEYYYSLFKKALDSVDTPDNERVSEIFYAITNERNNETYIFSDRVIEEGYKLSSSILDLEIDSLQLKKLFNQKTTTRIIKGVDGGLNIETTTKNFSRLKDYEIKQFENAFKNISAKNPIHKRVSTTEVQTLIEKKLKERGLPMRFEFAIYSNNLATKIKSRNFKLDPKTTYGVPIFTNEELHVGYMLYVNFVDKDKYVLGSILAMAILSFIFTCIILFTYASALFQLVRQRKIAQIKTDFINNMTHEFKTPIATINLALDALNNPKVSENKEFIKRYHQMIREENKRMHAQVENVLRISKLEKNELNLPLEAVNLHDIIEDAISHVGLIIEDKGGKITTQLTATNAIIKGNELHLTNVLINILDNAIKYSKETPEVTIKTYNEKNLVAISIEDKGIGMSKQAQKQIFEKFYRESTGDIHNVKGHGLGLAYVKRILDYHQAKITVESEKGKGTKFVIKFKNLK